MQPRQLNINIITSHGTPQYFAFFNSNCIRDTTPRSGGPSSLYVWEASTDFCPPPKKKTKKMNTRSQAIGTQKFLPSWTLKRRFACYNNDKLNW